MKVDHNALPFRYFASYQLLPQCASAMRGTFNAAAASISRVTSAMTASASSSGHSTISSSWTWSTSFAWGHSSARRSWTRIMAILMMSAAVP